MWKPVPGYTNYECQEDTRSGVKVRSKKRPRHNAMGIVTTRQIPARVLTPTNGRYRLVHHVNSVQTLFLAQDIWDATFEGKELIAAHLKASKGRNPVAESA